MLQTFEMSSFPLFIFYCMLLFQGFILQKNITEGF